MKQVEKEKVEQSLEAAKAEAECSSQTLATCQTNAHLVGSSEIWLIAPYDIVTF